jgi:AraC-like DNA-binding protein/ligand-binding sensor protein
MNATNLSSPANTSHGSNEYIVERVLRSELFRNYRSAFAAGTGLPLDFVGVDETLRMPYVGHKNESKFCRVLREGTGTAWQTANAIILTEAQKAGNVLTTTTIGGLLESCIPIHNGSETVGFLRVGQVLASQPSEGDFIEVAKHLSARRGLYAIESLKEGHLEIAVVPLNRYAGIVDLVKVFAAQLEEHINRIMLMKLREEPVAVRKAKQFIVENLGERLTLEKVASHAGMSESHFCRVFKEAVGMILTEFIGRLRIESAKRLLLNCSLRVTEIAFQVGFNSLSQFNRSFLRYVGEPPSAYREGAKEIQRIGAPQKPEARGDQFDLLVAS